MNNSFIIMLGLVNWVACLILVESEVFRPVRDWIGRRHDRLTLRPSDWHPVSMDDRGNVAMQPEVARSRRIRAWLWYEARFLTGCHLCTGTWVAFLQVAFFGGPFTGGWWSFLTNALVYKAVGHTIYTAWMFVTSIENKNRVTVEMAEHAMHHHSPFSFGPPPVGPQQ